MNKITVPERFNQMSERTLMRCIGRRLQRTQPKKSKMPLVISMAIVALSFTIAFARGGKVTTDEAVPVQPVQVTLLQVGEHDLWQVSEAEEDLLIRTVLANARGEGRLAMQAVAQAIRTTCEQDELTVAEAVVKYRWSTMIKGEVADEISELADDAVTNVIRGFYAVDEEIRFACNPENQNCSWHEENCTFVVQIGALRFYN